ncbi:hypothetical protein [Falsihalocynthiibacter sp. CO-5D18]|uniref:hypothetical protein n=1 Tax=Falsihalocynthiibacter sp. CO-5D18 TaxID=3240872 RepID=UPI00350F8B4E
MSDAPRTVILTGTAGDGKTYTARRVLDLVSGGTAAWANAESELSVISPKNGHSITFIKDLSEIRATDKKKLVPRIVESLFSTQKSHEVFVLCVNDGHLLKTWRENAADDPRADTSIEAIQGMLRDDLSEIPDLKMNLFNMSRTSHAATLDRIIDAITQHPAWGQCAGCPALGADQPCPIRVNRDILALDKVESVRARLRSLIKIAAADDAHLSIRQIMILVVNALLGDRKSSTPPLLDCSRAILRAGNNQYAETNPYSNLFGENHPPKRRHNVPAFQTLARFSIGGETNNYFDDALIQPDADHPMPQQDRYGAAIFESISAAYCEDPSNGIAALRPAIRDQRRRLFFMMTDEPLGDSRQASPWLLTAYHWGGLYINLLLSSDARDEAQLKAAKREIVKGMNRALTGALTETHDALWLSQPSGVYLGSEKPLLAFDPIRWRGSLYWLVLQDPQNPGRPLRLEIHTRDQDGPLSYLDLTPTLFEYLVRVAHGALPTSFTNQCYQDLRNFQIRSVGAITQAEKEADASIILKAVDASSEHLSATPIDLLEEML